MFHYQRILTLTRLSYHKNKKMYSLKQSDHLASFVFICKRSITINYNAKKKSDGVKHNYFFSMA